jgi:hypothetical protein
MLGLFRLAEEHTGSSILIVSPLYLSPCGASYNSLRISSLSMVFNVSQRSGLRHMPQYKVQRLALVNVVICRENRKDME